MFIPINSSTLLFKFSSLANDFFNSMTEVKFCGSFGINISKKDNNTVGPINNTENYQSSSQVKTNTDNKFSSDVNRASMSQIEKFNKRYGI